MMKEEPKKSYKYRAAYGWINDVRCEPLPLQNWPAPQFDDETVNSAIRAMEVEREAGFNMLDEWGIFTTWDWPADIVSALDKDRRRRIKALLQAANDRGLEFILGFGNFSWGYGKITAADPSVAGKDLYGKPLRNVLCNANPKSFEYVKKLLDFALSEFDFAGVHLESCDLGCCECPECAGKYGNVGYNIHINRKTAEYIRSRWPNKKIFITTVRWSRGGSGVVSRRYFNAEDKDQIVELSKHVDCIIDHGHQHHGYHLLENERRDFLPRLHCAWGTSARLWLYPDVRWDRASFFLPLARRAGNTIKEEYTDGVRGSLFFRGPVNNAGCEVTTAVGGRMLSDASRDVEEVLAEVIEMYYKPKSAAVRKRLVGIFQRAEDAYFGEKRGERMLSGLFNLSPGGASYLRDPFLNLAGRAAYRKVLISLLEDLAKVEGKCDDGGRVNNIKRSVIITLNLLNTVCDCFGEKYDEGIRSG